MSPTGVQEAIEKSLSANANQPELVLGLEPMVGGDINEVYLLTTNLRKVVAKLHLHPAHDDMFEAEARGLQLLKNANALRVPNVFGLGRHDFTAFLLIEYLPEGKRAPDFWKVFGRQLADLHRQTNATFGLDHNNYIGALPQPNKPQSSWAEFYATQHLEYQARYGRKVGWMSRHLSSLLDRLFHRLEDLFPAEPPALLHGDLWSGNYLVGPQNEPCLIDPAVYYGHREMDLAMTKLFGGFQTQLYATYNEVFPLAVDWEERLPVSQLYPIMVHANLFGGGYGAQAEAIIKRFS